MSISMRRDVLLIRHLPVEAANERTECGLGDRALHRGFQGAGDGCAFKQAAGAGDSDALGGR